MTVDVSRETRERLEQFSSLVLAWNRRINLVGTHDVEEFRWRHLADCLQLADLIDRQGVTLVDLGSGAGLPGLVIAICRPDLRITCVESDARKSAFLWQAIRALGLNAEVRNARIEAVPPLDAPVVTARGLAPLPRLLEYVERHITDGGTALLMKGRRWKEELEQARATWHFSLEAAPSRTDPQAVILSIGGLTRA